MRRRGKAFILALLILPLAMTTMAQELKKPTLEDLLPGGETYRYAQNIYGLQWWGDSCIKPELDKVYQIDPKNGKERLVFTLDEINKILEDQQLAKVRSLYNIEFCFANKPQVMLTLPGKYVILDFKTKQIVETISFDKKAANRDFCLANQSLAYTIDNNLLVNGKAVTNEPEGIVCGQSVHRNEFGIHKGTFWSPNGNLLAFYRMDERMVAQYPLVDITAPIGTVNNIRYPMAGQTSHKVQVGIYNPHSEKVVYLNTGDPTDRYFTNISWAPDEQSLFLIELNRDQNHSKLCQYHAQTGELMNVLLEETDPKYVEPQQAITFLPWDATRFIYQSQRNGFNHLYLYDINGKLVKQLTDGKWLVSELLGFNSKKKEAIITINTGIESYHASVNIQTGKISSALSLKGQSHGVHSGLLSTSGLYLIDRYSTPTTPRNIDVLNIKTGKGFNLLTAESPYKEFEMPSIETGTIKADDQTTDLYYRLVKPANFDPNKKYPVIIYVYGGPHAQLVNNGWLNGARGWDIYMANKGYIMFTLDNRGSSNRGLAFENATFRHLGIEEGKDQVKGVEFLKSLPFVDANRIGVHGWSFGGHMTTALMLRYPDLFKVGVAGGPVIDWGYYEVMYGERYMDTPQANPEGYQTCNLKNLAGQLKGHLLLIHDDHDDTCVPQHTLSFIKACVDARTYPDLFIYPGHKHNVLGKDRVHLYEKITRYFENNL